MTTKKSYEYIIKNTGTSSTTRTMVTFGTIIIYIDVGDGGAGGAIAPPGKIAPGQNSSEQGMSRLR